ncbi:unnamed protein product [Periconia digitata]|uniref:Uncharacterized protein n=1 Tax=Periconia digitata TaxID=1303443 RepID=A0A9W4UMC7_9PLEO|nr:unnamed protein product [Periconia digitata]
MTVSKIWSHFLRVRCSHLLVKMFGDAKNRTCSTTNLRHVDMFPIKWVQVHRNTQRQPRSAARYGDSTGIRCFGQLSILLVHLSWLPHPPQPHHISQADELSCREEGNGETDETQREATLVR